MAKKRRKRRPLGPKNTKRIRTPTTSTSNKDLIIAKRIARIDLFFILTAAIPPSVVIFLEDPEKVVPKAKNFILFSIAVFIIGILVNLFRGQSLWQSQPYSANLAEARKKGVWSLSFSIFVSISAWMPLFYYWGYIDQLADLLPGKEQLGDKLSLVIAFILGAIVSGVLGNLAYDILKWVIKRMMRSS